MNLSALIEADRHLTAADNAVDSESEARKELYKELKDIGFRPDAVRSARKLRKLKPTTLHAWLDTFDACRQAFALDAQMDIEDLIQAQGAHDRADKKSRKSKKLEQVELAIAAHAPASDEPRTDTEKRWLGEGKGPDMEAVNAAVNGDARPQDEAPGREVVEGSAAEAVMRAADEIDARQIPKAAQIPAGEGKVRGRRAAALN